MQGLKSSAVHIITKSRVESNAINIEKSKYPLHSRSLAKSLPAEQPVLHVYVISKQLRGQMEPEYNYS